MYNDIGESGGDISNLSIYNKYGYIIIILWDNSLDYNGPFMVDLWGNVGFHVGY